MFILKHSFEKTSANFGPFARGPNEWNWMWIQPRVPSLLSFIGTLLACCDRPMSSWWLPMSCCQKSFKSSTTTILTVTHICINKLTTIGSDNGMSPCRYQAIIWTDTEILLIGPLGTNFSEILIEIHTFSYTKMHFKMLPEKWQPFCLGLSVLNHAIIGSNNGLSHGRHQVIIWTQWCIVINWIIGNKIKWNSNQYTTILFQENSFEIIVCKMSSSANHNASCCVLFPVGPCVLHELYPIAYKHRSYGRCVNSWHYGNIDRYHINILVADGVAIICDSTIWPQYVDLGQRLYNKMNHVQSFVTKVQ